MDNKRAIEVLLDMQKRGRAFCRFTAVDMDDAMQLALKALGHTEPEPEDSEVQP